MSLHCAWQLEESLVIDFEVNGNQSKENYTEQFDAVWSKYSSGVLQAFFD